MPSSLRASLKEYACPTFMAGPRRGQPSGRPVDRSIPPAQVNGPAYLLHDKAVLPVGGSRRGVEGVEDYSSQVVGQALAFKSSHAVSPFKT